MRGVIALGAVVALRLTAPTVSEPQPSFGASPQTAGASTQTPPAPGPGVGRVQPAPVDFGNTTGWMPLFDGRTLTGWEGNPDVWKVEDGAITAVSTMERRVASTYIFWKGGEPGDFELKLEVRLIGSGLHSCIAYRSWIDPNLGRAGAGGAGGRLADADRAGAPPQGAAGHGAGPEQARGPSGGRAALPPAAIPSDPRWNLSGLGLDYDYSTTFDGNVEGRGTTRGEIAYRGGIVQTAAGKRPLYVGMIGDPAVLAKVIKPDEWNQLHIIAHGNQLTHIINGQVMAVLIDDDPTFRQAKGLIGWQVDGIGQISVRNIWLKTF